MLLASPNKPALLSMVAADGRTDLYGKVAVYNVSGGLVTQLNLDHTVAGIYSGTWTPSDEGYYQARYEFFADVFRTVSANYEIQAEMIDVTGIKENVLRVMGLLHENSVVDQQLYDGDQNLTSARIRCYDNAVNASAASAVSPAPYLTGLQFQYQVSASYAGGLLTKYNINRVM